MKREHLYESLIGQKLNGLATPDTTRLWDSMKATLNREMPQQPETKRRFGNWSFSLNSLLALSVLAGIGGVYSWSQMHNDKLFSAATEKQNNASLPSVALKKSLAPTISQATVMAAAEKPVILETNEGVKVRTTKEQVFHLPASIVKKSHAVAQVILGKEKSTTSIASTTNVVTDKNVNETEFSITNKSLANAELVKANIPAIFGFQKTKALLTDEQHNSNPKKRPIVYIDKGVSFGIALNYPIAIGGQRKNGLDINGKMNQWQDYLPSVYAQVYLNKKFYLQAEWSPVAAQYTPNSTVYHTIDQTSPDEKEEKLVKLNKLFYTNLPLSLHYNTSLKGLTVGAGLQYSSLKRVILQDQEYYHVIGPGYWTVNERKNEVAVKNPGTPADHNSGNVVDEVAGAFRRDDWRLLADVGYRYKALNGGLRFTKGLHPYINSEFNGSTVKDYNEAMQLYLHYNLFDTRKK